MSQHLDRTTNLGAELVEKVVVDDDLAKLSSEERLHYYKEVCQSVGLNPLTKPFEYIKLNGRLRLYALKGATDQLRAIHAISITELQTDYPEGLIVVTASATDKHGRTDSDTGAVPLQGLKGEARANAIMKAITKAKRRVTLSMVGLGMLDETEVDTIPNAQAVSVEAAHERTRLEDVAPEDDPFTGGGPKQGAKKPADATISEAAAKRLHDGLTKIGVTQDEAPALIERATGRQVDTYQALTQHEATRVWELANGAREEETA